MHVRGTAEVHVARLRKHRSLFKTFQSIGKHQSTRLDLLRAFFSTPSASRASWLPLALRSNKDSYRTGALLLCYRVASRGELISCFFFFFFFLIIRGYTRSAKRRPYRGHFNPLLAAIRPLPLPLHRR